MTVEMEITDQWHRAALRRERVADWRDRSGGGIGIDRDAHQLGAGAGQFAHLPDRGGDVGRVGVGHRLHHDRGITAHKDTGDVHSQGGMPGALAEAVFTIGNCRARVP